MKKLFYSLLILLIIPGVLAGTVTRSFSIDGKAINEAAVDDVITVTLNLVNDEDAINTLVLSETIPNGLTLINKDPLFIYDRKSPQELTVVALLDEFSPSSFSYQVKVVDVVALSSPFHGDFSLSFIPDVGDIKQFGEGQIGGDNTIKAVVKDDRELGDADPSCPEGQVLLDGACQVLQNDAAPNNQGDNAVVEEVLACPRYGEVGLMLENYPKALSSIGFYPALEVNLDNNVCFNRLKEVHGEMTHINNRYGRNSFECLGLYRGVPLVVLRPSELYVLAEHSLAGGEGVFGFGVDRANICPATHRRTAVAGNVNFPAFANLEGLKECVSEAITLGHLNASLVKDNLECSAPLDPALEQEVNLVLQEPNLLVRVTKLAKLIDGEVSFPERDLLRDIFHGRSDPNKAIEVVQQHRG